jgi:hypothetical protein
MKPCTDISYLQDTVPKTPSVHNNRILLLLLLFDFHSAKNNLAYLVSLFFHEHTPKRVSLYIRRISGIPFGCNVEAYHGFPSFLAILEKEILITDISYLDH